MPTPITLTEEQAQVLYDLWDNIRFLPENHICRDALDVLSLVACPWESETEE